MIDFPKPGLYRGDKYLGLVFLGAGFALKDGDTIVGCAFSDAHAPIWMTDEEYNCVRFEQLRARLAGQQSQKGSGGLGFAPRQNNR